MERSLFRCLGVHSGGRETSIKTWCYAAWWGRRLLVGGFSPIYPNPPRLRGHCQGSGLQRDTNIISDILCRRFWTSCTSFQSFTFLGFILTKCFSVFNITRHSFFHGWMDGRIDGLAGWTDGRTDKQTSELMDGCIICKLLAQCVH